MTARLQCTTTPAGLEALRDAWDQLSRSIRGGTAFQTWHWHQAWIAAYAGNAELAILHIEIDGRVVGIAPFIQTADGSTREFSLIGSSSSDRLDLIVDPNHEQEVRDVIAHWLSDNRAPCRVRLTDVGANSAAARFARTDGRIVCEDPGSLYLAVVASSWEELLAVVSAKRRETARRTIRRATADGLRWRERRRSSEDAESAARRWLSMHRGNWEGRGIVSAHGEPSFDRFAVELTRTSARLGGPAVIHELVSRDGQVSVSDLLLLGNDSVQSYVFGASGQARKRYEINTLLMKHWVDVAAATGVRAVSLGRGDEPYKLKWKPVGERNHNFVVRFAR